MTIRTLALPTLALCALAAARPERRAATGGADQASTPVTVALTIAGKAYNGKGSGTCTFAPVASIYGVRAQQYGVRLSDGTAGFRSLGLTVWRPAGGGADQMNLYMTVGSKSHQIDTVKGGGKQAVGGGTVSVQRKGMGGRFTIDGKDADGTAIRGTIECARLVAPNPVAG